MGQFPTPILNLTTESSSGQPQNEVAPSLSRHLRQGGAFDALSRLGCDAAARYVLAHEECRAEI
jgi:hypothetical protein